MAEQKGAEFLDEVFPGWAAKIDIFTLDMRDMNACILGQLYGDMGLGLAAFAKPFSWCVECSFILPYDEHASFKDVVGKYMALTERWRAEVEKRIAQENKDDATDSGQTS